MKTKDIEKLVFEGLITYEQGVEIEKFYSKKNDKFSMALLLPLLGVFLIGGGIISISAYNWSYFPEYVKIIIGLIPITVLSTIFYIKEEKISKVAFECMTLAIGLSVLFSLGITFQTLQTPISAEFLFIVCSICMLPIIYAFETYWLGVLSMFIMTFSSLFLGGIFLFSPYIFIPFYMKKIKQNIQVKTYTFLYGITILTIPSFLFETINLIYFSIYLLNLIYILFYEIDDGFGKKFVSIINFTYIFILGFVSFELVGNDSFIFQFPNIILAGIIFVITNRKIFDKDQLIKTHYINGIFLFQSIQHFAGEYGQIFAFFMPLLVGGVLLFNVYENFNLRDVKEYNLSIFLFASFVIIKMFVIDLDLILKGIMFVIIGISFFIANSRILKLIKEEQGDYDE